ncbi:nicotinate phosphoribosyltransferase [Archangium violaceum]|uniref:nicotinate phosphoribosyltransferase n=1 Tax=Archangium violaceum TaxID=83451 RepID=UPI00193B84C1|nr:nicotinate phosphoribosyltransferase [Archangium violaceum]QRK10411.1 nicotinate phosphoribosyltransferase [Archangium violaceum]
MSAALLTDLYELTMVDAYLAEGLHEEAAFSLFVRRLPARRDFLLACGLEEALTYLETLRFSPEELAWLESLGRFSQPLLDWLERFHFTGDVHAVPEGTPLFAEEPLLEVVAPLPEAQLVETYLLNQMHLQTLAASKAARVVEAARGRPVVDFGVRRMHGVDAGLKVARAAYVAGVSATSNLLAGQRYGIPVAGTLAHSYIQAHDDELAAFRAYVRRFPETTLLVDTYDTLEGVRKVVELARELGPDFQVRAVRLDSGDLVSLSHAARWLLDEAGLERVQIFASGGLDEDAVAQLLAHHAPIDAFGVGTAMGVSADAPSLDMAYKLVSYAGHGRLKLSTGKVLLPGRKQVFREEEDGVARRDVLARHDEVLPGRPLLRQVMHAGRRLEGTSPSLEAIRLHAREELARLPLEVTQLEPVRPPYPVEVSPGLSEARDRVVAELGEATHAT